MELWTRICQDIRKSKEKFDQQASLAVQIKTLVEKISREGNSKDISPVAAGATWLRPVLIVTVRGQHLSTQRHDTFR